MKRQTVTRLLAVTLSASLLLPYTAQAAVDDQTAAEQAILEQEESEQEAGQETAADTPKISEGDENIQAEDPALSDGTDAQEAGNSGEEQQNIRDDQEQPDGTSGKEAAGDQPKEALGSQETENRQDARSQADLETPSQPAQVTPKAQEGETDTGVSETAKDAGEDETQEDTETPEAEEEADTLGNWVRSGSRWWYQYRDGSYPRSQWEDIDGSRYYFDAAGWMVTGWQQIGGVWYYMSAGGQMQTGWQRIGGSWYYLNEEGKMQTGWQKVGGIWYYMNGSGQMLTGWQYLNGVWYYMDGSGHMLTGWAYVNGAWYYMNESGRMLTGWQQIGGKWYYLEGSGRMLTGWQYLGGVWYYMNGSGQMLTGWQQIGGIWYYMNGSGRMLTGWQLIGGSWYYLDGSGHMLTGWQQIGGTYYYLQPSGAMAADTWIGDWYVDDSGAWIEGKKKVFEEGWINTNGLWWYQYEDGSYAKSGWKTIGGKEYYFDDAGWMQVGWLKQNGTWYYLNSDGSKAYDQWIGKTGVGGYYINKYGRMVADGQYSLDYSIYTFDENGKCTGRENRYVTMKDPINGKNYLLERQIQTDPQVSDDELLAAAVYAEAGNQKMPGMTGVALVMLNRCVSSEYPSSVRFMLYQNQQFEVARNGTLTRHLNNINSSYLDDAKEAVAAARAIMEDYQKNGTPRTVEGLTMPEGKTDFDYMGFMTPAAFKNAGLDWEATDAFTYMNTTFYTRWIKEKS